MQKECIPHGERMRKARKEHAPKARMVKDHDHMHNGEKRMMKMEKGSEKRPSTMSAKEREKRSGGMERNDHKG